MANSYGSSLSLSERRRRQNEAEQQRRDVRQTDRAARKAQRRGKKPASSFEEEKGQVSVQKYIADLAKTQQDMGIAARDDMRRANEETRKAGLYPEQLKEQQAKTTGAVIKNYMDLQDSITKVLANATAGLGKQYAAGKLQDVDEDGNPIDVAQGTDPKTAARLKSRAEYLQARAEMRNPQYYGEALGKLASERGASADELYYINQVRALAKPGMQALSRGLWNTRNKDNATFVESAIQSLKASVEPIKVGAGYKAQITSDGMQKILKVKTKDRDVLEKQIVKAMGIDPALVQEQKGYLTDDDLIEGGTVLQKTTEGRVGKGKDETVKYLDAMDALNLGSSPEAKAKAFAMVSEFLHRDDEAKKKTAVAVVDQGLKDLHADYSNQAEEALARDLQRNGKSQVTAQVLLDVLPTRRPFKGMATIDPLAIQERQDKWDLLKGDGGKGADGEIWNASRFLIDKAVRNRDSGLPDDVQENILGGFDAVRRGEVEEGHAYYRDVVARVFNMASQNVAVESRKADAVAQFGMQDKQLEPYLKGALAWTLETGHVREQVTTTVGGGAMDKTETGTIEDWSEKKAFQKALFSAFGDPTKGPKAADAAGVDAKVEDLLGFSMKNVPAGDTAPWKPEHAWMAKQLMGQYDQTASRYSMGVDGVPLDGGNILVRPGGAAGKYWVTAALMLKQTVQVNHETKDPDSGKTILDGKQAIVPKLQPLSIANMEKLETRDLGVLKNAEDSFNPEKVLNGLIDEKGRVRLTGELATVSGAVNRVKESALASGDQNILAWALQKEQELGAVYYQVQGKKMLEQLGSLAATTFAQTLMGGHQDPEGPRQNGLETNSETANARNVSQEEFFGQPESEFTFPAGKEPDVAPMEIPSFFLDDSADGPDNSQVQTSRRHVIGDGSQTVEPFALKDRSAGSQTVEPGQKKRSSYRGNESTITPKDERFLEAVKTLAAPIDTVPAAHVFPKRGVTPSALTKDTFGAQFIAVPSILANIEPGRADRNATYGGFQLMVADKTGRSRSLLPDELKERDGLVIALGLHDPYTRIALASRWATLKPTLRGDNVLRDANRKSMILGIFALTQETERDIE